MPGRLAIDFGTSNTVLAVWDETARDGIPLHLPDYGRLLPGEDNVSLIPSLIHYAGESHRWVGSQVLERGLAAAPGTFRWMKRYITHRSPARRRVEGRELSHFDAGRDFLTSVLGFAAAEVGLADEEIALAVPVEAFEHYENWLAGVAEAVGMPRFRLIDEPSAAALGYGAHVQPGDVYLIFDFGGGTLDIAVVLIEAEEAAATGRRCRVLGKAGTDLGGASVDQWLFQEALRQAGRSDADDDVRPLSAALLLACERAKEQLSVADEVEIRAAAPGAGVEIRAMLTRGRFEELLDEHEALACLDQTIRRALNDARERGYAEDDLRAVLMVGGSSRIAAVGRTVQRIFGRERVLLHRPLDAVARGAAAFVAGVDFYDHIQHDYALRWLNPAKGGYDYRVLVKRATAYPTREPVARVTVKATHDGQTQLGLAIFEMGDRPPGSAGPALELVFDPSGAARVTPVSADAEELRRAFWVNEQSPTFLSADPPADRGESRFSVEFGVDANKRLVVTARDLRTGRLAIHDHPVVRLT